jgi:hypothetical protein
MELRMEMSRERLVVMDLRTEYQERFPEDWR